MHVQQYEPLPGPVKATGEVVLQAVGRPCVLDLMTFVNWHVWRGGLRHFAHSPGVIAGTLVTAAPEPISQRTWDVALADTPGLIVLETLVDQGWSVGQCSGAHTRTSPRIFQWKEQMNEKYYWQCLANLDKLFDRGLPELLIGKPNKYYAELLTVQNPGEVLMIGVLSKAESEQRKFSGRRR